MELEARPSRRWLARMGIVLVAFFGFACWCVYDGLVRYPEFNRRASVYNRLVVTEGDRDAWETHAKEHGWPARFEGEELKGDGSLRLKTVWDIRTQYFMAAVCLVIVFLVGFRLLRARGQRLRLDEAGFHSADGRCIRLESIRELDKSKWQRKSIVTVYYDAGGRREKAVIDDWIFEGAEAILLAIEERLGQGTSTVASEDVNVPAEGVSESSGGQSENESRPG